MKNKTKLIPMWLWRERQFERAERAIRNLNTSQLINYVDEAKKLGLIK